MKLGLNCRESARLILQGEDRRLGLAERLALRVHLTLCDGCTRFVGQVGLMRGAMQRWRAYTDRDTP
jgi:hypothetical protein